MEPSWVKWGQDEAKMGPTWAKMGPRWGQDGAKRAPRWAKRGHLEPPWKTFKNGSPPYLCFGDSKWLQNWLKIKLALFAITVGVLIVVNKMFKPFGPAFERLISEGSSPEVEKTISSLIIKGKPWIWSIWIIVVLNTALGLFKPF